MILLQGTLNPSKLSLSKPYDSTQGVVLDFIGLHFLSLFVAIGVLKAIWGDPQWRVRIIKNSSKRKVSNLNR
jgi:hypothetical protein